MGSIRVLALLVALVWGVGCQAITKTQSRPGASTVESSPLATTGTERPDVDALSPGWSPPPPEAFVAVARLANIHFDYDAHDIRPADTPILDENAAWLKANPDAILLIEGHTDERGTSDYNLGLGDLRATAAMHYLIARGGAGGPHGGHLLRRGAARLHRSPRGVLGAEPTRPFSGQAALRSTRGPGRARGR